jgi:hypothetical protein
MNIRYTGDLAQSENDSDPFTLGGQEPARRVRSVDHDDVHSKSSVTRANSI